MTPATPTKMCLRIVLTPFFAPWLISVRSHLVKNRRRGVTLNRRRPRGPRQGTGCRPGREKECGRRQDGEYVCVRRKLKIADRIGSDHVRAPCASDRAGARTNRGEIMKPRWLRRFAVVSSSVAIALAIDPLWAQQGAAGGEWRSYAGDLGATKYSPLSQIDARNFGTLRVVWRWQSADRFLSRTIPGRGEVWANASLTFDQLNKADPKRWRDGEPPTITNFKATP